MAWYPLGRPVGTTIYPGMQISAAAVYHGLSFVGEHLMSPREIKPSSKRKWLTSTKGSIVYLQLRKKKQTTPDPVTKGILLHADTLVPVRPGEAPDLIGEADASKFRFRWHISLNDVCVFVPAGFAVLTTLFTFLL